MPNFGTKVNEWDGAYAPPRTVTASKDEGGWGALAAKIIPGALEAAGKGYAQAKGSNIQGLETTAQEALAAVEEFDKAVPFTDDPSNTPDQRAQIEDMRTAALKKFATNDKKIQALVTAGKISALEANARRHQLIQDNLSNPVLAMFKEDFLDASTPFTGGSGELAKQYFGAYLPTEEERVQSAMVDQAVKDKVAFQSQVEQTAMAFGISKEQATIRVQAAAHQEAKVKQLEAEYNIRRFSSDESYMASMEEVNLFSTQVGGQIAALAASGQKINDPSILIGKLEQARIATRQRMMKYTGTMTREAYAAAEAELDRRVNSLKDVVNSADGMEFLQKKLRLQITSVDANIAGSQQRLLNSLGDLYTIHKFSPELANRIHSAMMGDKAGEMYMATDPLARKIVNDLGIKIDPTMLPEIGNDISNGKTDGWSFAKAWTGLSSFWTGGSEGVKAEVEVSKKQPDVHEAMLKSAFSNPDMSLDKYANSKDYIAAAKTPDGAATVARAIQVRLSDAKARQIRMGAIPEGDILFKEVPQMSKGLGGNAYQFNVNNLDPSIKDDIIQVYKITKNSPQVLKLLGANSPEEYISKIFKNVNATYKP